MKPSEIVVIILGLEKEIHQFGIQSLHRAVKVGDYLTELKEELGFGKWLPFCETHLVFKGMSQRTINRRMKVYRWSTTEKYKYLFDGTHSLDEIHQHSDFHKKRNSTSKPKPQKKDPAIPEDEEEKKNDDTEETEETQEKGSEIFIKNYTHYCHTSDVPKHWNKFTDGEKEWFKLNFKTFVNVVFDITVEEEPEENSVLV